MDALLTALLACLWCEVGGANQRLALMLAQRFERDGPVLAGMVGAVVANAVLSAGAGWYVSMLIGADARNLLLAMALVFGGSGMLLSVKQPDALSGWRVGPFATALFGLFILSFGDASQFLMFGVAARTADPILTVLGGTIGMLIASTPVVIIRRPILNPGALVAVRRAGGLVLLMTGAILGLSATKML